MQGLFCYRQVLSRAAGAFGVLQLAAALGPPVTPVLAIRSRKAAASRSTPKGFADCLFLGGLRPNKTSLGARPSRKREAGLNTKEQRNMKRIATIFMMSWLLVSAAMPQPGPAKPSENGPQFQAYFPPPKESNATLLMRFRDEIMAAAGLEGGFEGLNLPADLSRREVAAFGTLGENGDRHFAVAFRTRELPAEFDGKPSWTRHANSVVWVSDSFPSELAQRLVGSLPQPGGDTSSRFQMQIQAKWMGLPRTGDPSVVDLPGGSLGQALASIDQVDIEGKIGKSVEMAMTARFPGPAQTAIVADAWRSFLFSFRGGSGGPQQVLDSLSRTKVFERGRDLEIRVPLSEPALERLRHAQASRQFLNWAQLGYGREASERLPELFQILGAIKGARIADLGAGSGFLTLRLARAVGRQGKVFAIDINAPVLDRLRERVRASRLRQVEVIEGKADNPGLGGKNLDAVLIVNAYHEMPAYTEILQHLKRSLRPGGKLVLLEPYSPEGEKKTRDEQVGDHQIAPELVVQELEKAGFEVILIDREYIGNTHEDHSHHNGLVVARKSP